MNLKPDVWAGPALSNITSVGYVYTRRSFNGPRAHRRRFKESLCES